MKAFRLLALLAAAVVAGCGDGSVQSPDFTPQLKTLVVSPATATVADGLTFQFTATGTFTVPPGSDDAEETRELTSGVKWESSDPAVATIDGSGLATGVSQGTTTIKASKEGKSHTAVLTVGPAELTGIVIQPANPTVPLGGTAVLTAVGSYSDGTTGPLPAGSTVNWTSSAQAVATVAPTPGNPTTVTGVSNGTSTVTATVGTLSGTTLVTIGGFPIPDGGLTKIVPANPTVAVGDTIELTAYGLFNGVEGPVDDSYIDWTSATTSVATIDANGVATGVAKGTSTIKAALKSTVVIQSGNREVTAPLTVVDGIFALCETPLLDPDATATKATVGLLDVGTVSNPEYVTDTNLENFAGVTSILGAVTGGTGIRVDAHGPTYGVPFVGGRSPGFIIGREAGTLAELDLFQQIEVSTLLNGVVQETTGDTDLLRLGLLGFQLLGSNDLRLVTIPASIPYDGIRVVLRNRVAGVITNLQVYRACASTKLPPIVASTLQSVLRVEPADEAIEAGETIEFRAIGQYPDGDDSNTDAEELQIPDDQLNWTVTPATGATINELGVLTGAAAGPVTVTATLKDGVVPAATPRTASAGLSVTPVLCETRFQAPEYETISEVDGLLCSIVPGSCRATNIANVTDAPKANYAEIDILLNLLNLGSVSVEVQPTAPIAPVTAGGQPGFVIGRQPAGTALLGLLNQFTVETLLGGTVQETASGLSALELDLLGNVLIGESEANVVKFSNPTTLPYDGLRLSVTSVLGALVNVQVFQACAATPAAAP